MTKAYVWTTTDALAVGVHRQGDRVHEAVVTEHYAVSFTGDDSAGIEGPRDALITALQSALEQLRALPEIPEPRPLGVCECGEPVCWRPDRGKYLTLTEGNEVCRSTAHGVGPHSIDNDATGELHAEHTNAYHVTDPEPGCPWCVLDVAEAGNPQVRYLLGDPDPTRPTPRLAASLAGGEDTVCGADSGRGYGCTWRDPIHLERDVPHIAGDGQHIKWVWSPEAGPR